jgi:hypothetical protein
MRIKLGAEAFAADYEALKRRYDPSHHLLDLYDKCVCNG